MGFFIVITLAILAALVLARELEEKWPDSRSLIDWLRGSSDWIGVISLAIGLINLLRLLPQLKYFGFAPGVFLVWLGGAVVMILLGLLLGQNLLRHWAGSQPKVVDTINKWVDKAAPQQKNLGYAAAILSVVMFLMVIF